LNGGETATFSERASRIKHYKDPFDVNRIKATIQRPVVWLEKGGEKSASNRTPLQNEREKKLAQPKIEEMGDEKRSQRSEREGMSKGEKKPSPVRRPRPQVGWRGIMVNMGEENIGTYKRVSFTG